MRAPTSRSRGEPGDVIGCASRCLPGEVRPLFVPLLIQYKLDELFFFLCSDHFVSGVDSQLARKTLVLSAR